VALGAVTAYAAMRAFLPSDPAQAASGDVGSGRREFWDNCDYVGYLGHGENVCYSDLDPIDRLLHWGWNAGAALVATFLPPLFTGNGILLLPDVLAGPLGEADTYPGFSIPSLFLPLLISVCAFVGLKRHPRTVLPLFVLIVVTAALNFILFRDRNLMVGTVGLYVAAAVGMPVVASTTLARARAFVRRSHSPGGTRARAALPLAALCLVALAIGWRAADFNDAVAGAKGSYEARDPCPSLYDLRPGVAEQVRDELGSRASDCEVRTDRQSSSGASASQLRAWSRPSVSRQTFARTSTPEQHVARVATIPSLPATSRIPCCSTNSMP
jgi:hypothetical protein